MPTFIVTALTLVASLVGRFAGLFSFVLNPFGSIVSAAFSIVASIAKSPLGRAVLITLVLAVAVAGAYFTGVVKGSRAEHVALAAQYQKEIADADARADAARAAADKKFSAGRFNNRPGLIPGRVRKGTDGFARD